MFDTFTQKFPRDYTAAYTTSGDARTSYQSISSGALDTTELVRSSHIQG